MCKTRCRTMTPEQEKGVMIRGFIVFSVLQSVAIVVLCSVSIYFLQIANISFFLPVDIVTLMIGIIFLSIIVVIVAWSSALVNMSCLWAVFHSFMIVLLLIEMVICMYTSNVSQFFDAAENSWAKSDDTEKSETESDLQCCGFYNTTDRPGKNCPKEYTKACGDKFSELMITIRNTASVALFVTFVFGMFIDFAACAICFHPDTITLEEHEREESLAIGVISRDRPLLEAAYNHVH